MLIALGNRSPSRYSKADLDTAAPGAKRRPGMAPDRTRVYQIAIARDPLGPSKSAKIGSGLLLGGNLVRRRRILFLAFASCVGLVMPVAADQNDPRLKQLSAALVAAPTTEAARQIEQRIWAIWTESGIEAVDTLMSQGIARLNEGDNDAALGLFDRVVALAPNFAEGWNKRATTLYSMGRFEKSVQDIGKVLALEPRHFGALSGLGLCNIRLGKDREALAAFQRAAALDPNLPGVQANIEALKKRLVKDSI